MIYKYLAVVLGVGASLGGAFLYGQHVATVSAERDALASRVIASVTIDTLTVRLRGANEALLIEQQRAAVVQREEVIKYVTKYRDKIIEVPSIVEYIDNSGLLDLLNASTPTIPVAQPTGGVTN